MPKLKQVSVTVWCAVCMLSGLLISGTVGMAYTSAARTNLLKSLEALRDQRSQLERVDGELDAKIRDLQKQQSTIDIYLRDIDRSIKEIERTLNAQDSAVRGF